MTPLLYATAKMLPSEEGPTAETLIALSFFFFGKSGSCSVLLLYGKIATFSCLDMLWILTTGSLICGAIMYSPSFVKHKEPIPAYNH